MTKYIINPKNKIQLNNETVLSHEDIINAILLCNQGLKQISESASSYDINVFEALGMRNLSGFVGEVFVSNLQTVSKSSFIKNPHQDGYPDLLLTNTEDRKLYFNTIIDIIDNKVYPKNKRYCL